MMHKGWLLFWTGFLISAGVNNIMHGNYGSATFNLVFGIGIGVNLINRYFKE